MAHGPRLLALPLLLLLHQASSAYGDASITHCGEGCLAGLTISAMTTDTSVNYTFGGNIDCGLSFLGLPMPTCATIKTKTGTCIPESSSDGLASRAKKDACDVADYYKIDLVSTKSCWLYIEFNEFINFQRGNLRVKGGGGRSASCSDCNGTLVAQDCITPVCGNGILEPTEECDDGNTANGDGCSDRCKTEVGCCDAGAPAFCGFAEPARCSVPHTEGGNCAAPSSCCTDRIANTIVLADADCCTALSHTPGSCPVCGDGSVDGTEDCDDGNTISGDGCDFQCFNEVSCCSDVLSSMCAPAIPSLCASNAGIARPGDGSCSNEASQQACCVGGTAQRCADPACCEALPQATLGVCTTCGNGVVQPGEECDDGNTVDGDGCSAGCDVESDWACAAGQTVLGTAYACFDVAPSVCTEVRGSCCWWAIDPAAERPQSSECTNSVTASQCAVIAPQGGPSHFNGGGTVCPSLQPDLRCCLNGQTIFGPAAIYPDCCDVLQAGAVAKIGSETCTGLTGSCCRTCTCADDATTIVGGDCAITADDARCQAHTFDGAVCPPCAGVVAVEARTFTQNAMCQAGACAAVSVCGDGVLNAPLGEECDDSNTASGDGCGSTCIVERGTCCQRCLADDNTTVAIRGCVPDSTSALCRPENLMCDTAHVPVATFSLTAQCSDAAFCTPQSICGDGVVNPALGEQCDDGNTASGDGCSASCTIETGWSCATGTEPSVCCPPDTAENAGACCIGKDNFCDFCSCNLCTSSGGNWSAPGVTCEKRTCGCPPLGVSTGACQYVDPGTGAPACRECDCNLCAGFPDSTFLGDNVRCPAVTTGILPPVTTGEIVPGACCQPDGICRLYANPSECPGATSGGNNFQLPGGACTAPQPCCSPTGDISIDPLCCSAFGYTSGACTVCGNGILEAGEECDDGNTDNTDGCNTNCLLMSGCCFDESIGVPSGTCANTPPATCALDGVPRLGGGLCADAPNLQPCCINGVEKPAVDPGCCTALGHTPGSCIVCGNGILEAGEECDDGNTGSGDGCSSTCTHESGSCCINCISDDDITTVSSTCQVSEPSNTCGDFIDCLPGSYKRAVWDYAAICGPTFCPPRSTCGDGAINNFFFGTINLFGEECDDGNTINGDGCSSTCKIEAVGTTGVATTGTTGVVTAGVPAPVCGNLILDAGEECDDGNIVNGDGCSASCVIESGTCCINCIWDDDITIVSTQCLGSEPSNTCGVLTDCPQGSHKRVTWEYVATCGATFCPPVSICGDGVVNPSLGEECDDGNTAIGDGCSNACTIDLCGNGVLDAGEACDDGNVVDNDGCSPTCTKECGDGIVGIFEECDDGNVLDNDGCSPTCTKECGDGTTGIFEGCDDGNLVNGDGCSSVCLVEPGWTCSRTSPGVCSMCGNGIVEGSEQCDDGNAVETDGCLSTCTVSSGWGCQGSPSVCSLLGRMCCPHIISDACHVTTEAGCNGIWVGSVQACGVLDTCCFDGVPTSGVDPTCCSQLGGTAGACSAPVRDDPKIAAIDGQDHVTWIQIVQLCILIVVVLWGIWFTRSMRVTMQTIRRNFNRRYM